MLVRVFVWGCEEELVQPNTAGALKMVKHLPEGHPGTFDNEERENVHDEIVRRTLPFLPPTLRAMIILQRLTGCRPSEIFNMRVGEIDRTRENGLWYYMPRTHKTKKRTGKKIIPLGLPEQELIAPYLVGKTSEQAVFSPRTAMAERNAEKQANRKTKKTPSQVARDAARAAKPPRYREFYNRHSYLQAIEYAIQKANKSLPDGEKIPHWTPYQLRHSAGTETSLTAGKDKAKALLGHRSTRMTDIYDHSDLLVREELALKRVNPYDTGE